MRILLAVKLKNVEEVNFLSNNIIYRPDLAQKNYRHLIPAIIDTASEIVVTNTILNRDMFKNDLSSLVNLKKVIILSNNFDGFRMEGIDVVGFCMNEKGLNDLFAYIERKECIGKLNFNVEKGQKRISLVGSGIINLFIGFELAKEGHQVEFYDSRPNPKQLNDDRHKLLGSTFGGEDARIFSFTECRHHFAFKENINSDYFRKSILNDGRICLNEKFLHPSDEQWIRNFEKIPKWITGHYHQDMVVYNKLSYDLWLSFFEENNKKNHGLGFVDRLFRIYSTQGKYESAIKKLADNGSFLSNCTKKDFLRINPCFEDAWQNGHIYKALSVKGFSVNVHRLGEFLITQIQKLGGSFNWNSNVTRINRNKKSVIVNLELENGGIIDSEFIIFCPGAYGEKILQNTQAKGLVSSVVGMWLKIPNKNLPMNYPVKIARSGVGVPGPCESANIITGNDSNGDKCIYISSGHGYIGFNQNINEDYINELGKGVIDVALKYFPDKIDKSPSQLKEELTYCIRGWTPSCLGVFDIEEKENGAMLLVTGHNTGGFAQAPIISDNVKKIIKQEKSDMLVKYNSQRVKNYLKF